MWQWLLLFGFAALSLVVFVFTIEFWVDYRLHGNGPAFARWLLARCALLQVPENAAKALAVLLAFPPALFAGIGLRRGLWYGLILGSVAMMILCAALAGAYQLVAPEGADLAMLHGPFAEHVEHLAFIIPDQAPPIVAEQLRQLFWAFFTWYAGLVAGLLGAGAVPVAKRLLGMGKAAR